MINPGTAQLTETTTKEKGIKTTDNESKETKTDTIVENEMKNNPA